MTDAHATPGQEDQRLLIDVQDDAPHNLVQVQLKGRIDIFTYQSLSQRLALLYENRPGLVMVLDLKQVQFVASSGWATLLTLRSRLSRMGGRVALAGMNEDLDRIYDSMKLGDLIPRFPDAAQATQALVAA